MLLLSLSFLAVFARLVNGQPLAGGGYRRYGGNFDPYNCIPYQTYGGSYGNVGGGGYPGGGYGGGGYGGGAKPSYVYTSPYQPSSNYGYGYGQGYRPGQNYGGGQGYTGGLSGYEGPSGGYNTYTQPAISYPHPNYYGAGYGSGSSTYNNANLPPMGYGNQNGNGITGQTSALDCIDRSGDCAVQAATGQCASNPTVQALCPRSCGICRSIINLIASTAGGGIGNTLGGSFPPFGVGGLGVTNFPPTGLSPNAPFTGIPESTFLAPQLGQFPQLGFPQQFPQCADAHVDGCPVWAALGYCQQAPEFMSSYCRASCGLCQPVPMTGIFPDVLPFAGDRNAPFTTNFDDLSQLASGTGMQSPFPFTTYPYKSSIFSASGFEKRALNKALFDSENADRPPSSLSTIVRMDQLAGSA